MLRKSIRCAFAFCMAFAPIAGCSILSPASTEPTPTPKPNQDGLISQLGESEITYSVIPPDGSEWSDIRQATLAAMTNSYAEYEVIGVSINPVKRSLCLVYVDTKHRKSGESRIIRLAFRKFFPLDLSKISKVSDEVVEGYWKQVSYRSIGPELNTPMLNVLSE